MIVLISPSPTGLVLVSPSPHVSPGALGYHLTVHVVSWLIFFKPTQVLAGLEVDASLEEVKNLSMPRM